MLMAGRSCAIALSLLLGLAIAFLARRYFGYIVAITAVVIYAADPNFLANGRYMKNDVAAALMVFVAVMIWGSYLARPRPALLWISGVSLGLALATKSPALVLLPVMLILYGIREWQQRRPFSILICVRRFRRSWLCRLADCLRGDGFEIKPLGESGIFRSFLPNAVKLARTPVPAVSYFRLDSPASP
jgi:dolichyl-phosphate-mannose--protein O-mannosyl transferase